MDLTQKKCVPCEGGIPRLTAEEIARLAPAVPAWVVADDGRKISRRFTFDDFKQAVAFVNRVAQVAEEEQHHPDFTVRYSVVDVVVYTHAIGGLSENDFILAAKLDRVV